MAQIAKSRFVFMYALALAAVFTLSAVSGQAQQTKSNIQAMTGWQNCTTCHVAVHGSNLSPRLFK